MKQRARDAFGRLAACSALVAGCGSHPADAVSTSVQSKPQRVDASDADVHDAAPTPVDASIAPPVRDASMPDVATAPADATIPAVDASLEAAAPQDAAVADEPPPEPNGPASCGFTPCVPGQPCPDLVVDVDDLKSSILDRPEDVLGDRLRHHRGLRGDARDAPAASLRHRNRERGDGRF